MPGRSSSSSPRSSPRGAAYAAASASDTAAALLPLARKRRYSCSTSSPLPSPHAEEGAAVLTGAVDATAVTSIAAAAADPSCQKEGNGSPLTGLFPSFLLPLIPLGSHLRPEQSVVAARHVSSLLSSPCAPPVPRPAEDLALSEDSSLWARLIALNLPLAP